MMIKKSLARFSTFASKLASMKTKLPQYTKPLVEGQYEVTPGAGFVPDHIPRPGYMTDKNQPFGIYKGQPVVQSNETIESLRKAAKIASETAAFALTLNKIGMTGDEGDHLIHEFILSKNAYPTPIGFQHFPKSVCISPNEVLCHGIPNKRPFEDGDYVNYDISVFIDGVHGDNSVMVEYGNVHPDVKKLIQVTQQALYESIKVCKPNAYYRDIGAVCDDIAEKNGYTSCEFITAHGIGPFLHMPPMIPHYRTNMPEKMLPGHVFTIEPIFMMKSIRQPEMWSDGWTLVAPNIPSAQWEHTVLITENGYEVLMSNDGTSLCTGSWDSLLKIWAY